MCGISGAIGILSPELVAGVQRAHAALAHRGPDGEGTWLSDGAADAPRVLLQHRRLAILDLSPLGAQPMAERPEHALDGAAPARSPAPRSMIAYNGELFGHRELRAELTARGARFAGRSDTEVLIAALRAHGADALGRLRGMFAFAWYDAERREVLLARDRMGKKPLYVAEVERDGRRAVLFASEVRALLATEHVERRLDPAGLATYLWNGFVPGPGTIVRGVRHIPPGTFARVELDRPRVEPRRYWSIPRAPAAANDDPRPLAEELARAVALRLESDVPLGVFLSGGVDSSAVAALAVRAGAGEVRTFNVAFDEAEFDESRWARAVAEHLGTRHVELRLTSARFRERLPDALASLDQPTFDQVNTWFVSRAVRDAGVVVALAGAGGDELFGGYKSFQDLPRAARWARRAANVPEHLLRAGARAVARAKVGRFGAVPPQTRWGKLGDLLAARGDLVASYQVSYALYTRAFLAELAPALARSAGVRDGLLADRRAELARAVEGEPELAGIAHLELETFLGDRLLRDTDAASMSVGLEARAPFVDAIVVERACALGPRARFAPLGKKEFLREHVLEACGLDRALFERPKSGFVLPFERWCRAELAGEVEGAFLDAARWEELGLAPGAVARLWSAFSSGAPGLYWSRVWALFVLSRWCRAHRMLP
ncbi:MAG: asparagine synthase (glutamine-hydrolyzing) [Planctomycetes bacterium]|nr:asparagine synthase (glutamine-hydrolyzing) [Planctomycetota bacterium]